MRMILRTFMAIACCLISAQSAKADFITLYNTGVVNANNPDGTNSSVITVGGTLDSHYTVDLPGGGTNFLSAFVATDQNNYFRPAPASAQYINDLGTAVANEVPGNYDYRTTFDLAGLDPTTATISGRIFVDNSIVDILVNGVSTGINGGTFTQNNQLDFTIPLGFAGFQNGLNTLDFIVNNAPGAPGNLNNPEAFYATSLVGTAAAIAVPEPSTLALIGLAGVGLAATRFRRRKALRTEEPTVSG